MFSFSDQVWKEMQMGEVEREPLQTLKTLDE